MHMRRKELRKMADEIKQQHGISMISIPWEFADQIVYEGYESAKARGQSGLENFHEVRSIIATGKPKEQAHPIYRKLDADGSARRRLARAIAPASRRAGVALLDFDRRLGAGVSATAARSPDQPLVLNPLQKEERFNAIVREAVKTLCAGENGQAFKRRMEDMALYFLETNRADRGEACSRRGSASRRRLIRGCSTFPFSPVLMQKSFAFFMSQEKAKTGRRTVLADHQAIASGGCYFR